MVEGGANGLIVTEADMEAGTDRWAAPRLRAALGEAPVQMLLGSLEDARA
jgi:hypothetical protein